MHWRVALLLLVWAPTAWADLQAQVGHISTTTAAAGNTVTITTSPAFAPKCLLLWWNHRTNTTNAVGGASSGFGVGFASSTTARKSVAAMSVDNQTGADVRSLRQDDQLVTVASAGAVDGKLDVQSFNSNGATLVIDDAFTASYTIHYIALGGSDVTNCAVGSFTTGTATGDLAVTGVGFQPDTVWLLDATFLSTDPTGTNTLGLSLGVAAGATPANAVTAIFSDIDGTNPNNTKRYSLVGESWASWSTAGAIDGRASVAAWTDDGFTFNRVEATVNKTVYYMAIKGPQFRVGSGLTQTDTTTDTSSGALGFTPALAVVGSHLTTESATNTPQDHIEISLGAATSTTVSRALAMLDEDNLATTEVASAIEFGSAIAPVLLNISTADAIEGRMKVQSFADPLLFRMDDADPSQNFFWWWIVGSNATTIPPTGFSTVSGNSWNQASGVATPVDGFSVIRWNTASGPNQQAAFPITTIPTEGDAVHLVFRLEDGGGNLYRCVVQRVAGTTNDTVALEKVVAGVVTVLAPPVSLGVDIQAGDQVGVDVATTAISCNYWSLAAAWASLCAGGGDWCTVVTGTAATTPVASYIGMGATTPVTVTSFAGTISAVTGDTTPPSTPANCAATVLSDTQLSLTCDASTDDFGVVSYRDEQCAGGGCSSWAQIRDTSATTWLSQNLTANTLYRHRRCAWDGVQCSSFSSIFEGTTLTVADTTAPSIPGSFAVTLGAHGYDEATGSTAVVLTYTASTDNVGVTGYLVERGEQSDCSDCAQICEVTTTTVTISGLDAVTACNASVGYAETRYYRVRAKDLAGNMSSYTSTVGITTPAQEQFTNTSGRAK